MSVLVWAIDGLDGQYVQERGLMRALDPKILHQDLEGENGLYTFRVWPCIFKGEIGGESDLEYDSWEPEGAMLWDKYAATCLCIPGFKPPKMQYQDAFPEGFHESTGPQERIEEQVGYFRKGLDEALADDRELIIAGTKQPDMVGHNDQNVQRCHNRIERFCNFAERYCEHPDVRDWLVVSDHGFRYDEFGTCKGGIRQHTRRSTFASSFCDYDTMSEFIENWHNDVDEVLREQRLEAMGYIE